MKLADFIHSLFLPFFLGLVFGIFFGIIGLSLQFKSLGVVCQ